MTVVRVTFYDNFHEADVSHMTLDAQGEGVVEIEIVATAGTWEFSFWFQSFPGDDAGEIVVGPFAWNVSNATLEAAIEAAMVTEHPAWVVGVSTVDGKYHVDFGSGDFGDPEPNAYRNNDINLSGHFEVVWDEHPHDVLLTADPGCGAGADPEDVPPGEIESTGRRGGSVRMPHPCSGAKLD